MFYSRYASSPVPAYSRECPSLLLNGTLHGNPTLEAQITELVGHLNCANHRLLTLLAEFDRRNGWADCRHAILCALAQLEVRHRHRRRAREGSRSRMRCSRCADLRSHGTAAELSYSKVRAINACRRRATEELLLSIALPRHGSSRRNQPFAAFAARSRRRKLRARHASQAARRVTCIYDERRLAHHQSVAAGRNRRAVRESVGRGGRSGIPGTTRFRGNVGGDDHPTPGERPTLSVRRADALARVAESFLAHGAAALARASVITFVVHVDAQNASLKAAAAL